MENIGTYAICGSNRCHRQLIAVENALVGAGIWYEKKIEGKFTLFHFRANKLKYSKYDTLLTEYLKKEKA